MKVNSQIKEICCGSLHSYVLSSDNMLYSCGANSKGQLGMFLNKKLKLIYYINKIKGIGNTLT